MKTIKFFICILLISCSVNSQTPIPVGNQITSFSSMVRGYYFTSPVNFTICGLEVPPDANTGAQTVRVVRFNSSAPPNWPGTTNNFTQLFSQTNFTVA